VNRHGQIQPHAITSQVVALVVKRYAAAAGLDSRKYAGHSLRAGLVTAAVLNHVDLPSIQRQSRHKSLDMLMRYARIANVFEGNVSARVGL
jgi:site-specific recombinase XerD